MRVHCETCLRVHACARVLIALIVLRAAAIVHTCAHWSRRLQPCMLQTLEGGGGGGGMGVHAVGSTVSLSDAAVECATVLGDIFIHGIKLQEGLNRLDPKKNRERFFF